MGDPVVGSCSWCLSTPPRHERCDEWVFTLTRISRDGEYPTRWHVDKSPCRCECRDQGTLW